MTAATATRKVSATNMVEKAPRSKKGPAMVSGANGHALAATFIQSFEAVGRALEEMQVSRKDRLRMVQALDKPGIVAFHGDMLARAEQVNTMMKEAQKGNPLIKGLREFFELHSGQQTIYVETSMWKKMALAIDAGFKPDYDMSWVNISAAATKHGESMGQTSNDPANPQAVGSSTKKAKKKGAPTKTPEVKAASAALNALKDEKGNALPKNNRNLSKVVQGIIEDATLEELIEVAAVVQNAITAANTAQAKLKEIASKKNEPQPQGDGTAVQKTSTGATVVHREAGVPPTKATRKIVRDPAKIEEHAEAKK